MMHTWTKRGLQTVLVTGGLLVLGTGVASAQENVSPDKPANPLDVSVDVPIHTQDNQLATPLGTAKMPDVDKDIKIPSVNDATGNALDAKSTDASQSTDSSQSADSTRSTSTDKSADTASDATSNSDASDSDPAAETASKVTATATKATSAASDTAGTVAGAAGGKTDPSQAASKVADTAKSAVGQATDAVSPSQPKAAAPKAPMAPSPDSVGNGNQVNGNVTVPIEICGNSVGVLADSSVSGSCDQTTTHDQDVTTDGAGSAFGGNVVKADGAVPVQITGNALGVLGTATSDYSATQNTTSTGNVTSDGTGSFAGGNVVGASPAVPVQVNGVAGGLLGDGQANSTTENVTKTGGWMQTHGDQSTLGGNTLGAPLAPSAAIQDTALGNASSNADNSKAASDSGSTDHVTQVTSGSGNPDASNIPMYESTDGKDSLLGGNTGATDAATPISACGIAGGGLGDATANCGSSTTSDSGSATVTDGTGSDGGGNAVHTPVAFPVDLTGIAGSLLGTGTADGTNDSDVAAGGSVAPVQERRGNTYTNGNDSVGGANVVSAPLANSGDVCALAGSFLGTSTASCDNTVSGQAGGYDGSLGNNATAAGNVIATPLSIPAEFLGIGTNALGDSTATASEDKDLTAGGESNSYDDNGLISSNVLTTPGVLPAQLFGIAAGGGGNAVGTADTDTSATAGGYDKAHADNSGLSGNIVTAPLALPAQLFGLGGSVFGTAEGTGDNTTDATSGGNNLTTGKNGLGAANVVAVPGAGIAQVFGDSLGAIDEATGTGRNDTTTTAGGTTTTDGTSGKFSGNALQAPIDPVAQVFGDAVGVLGNNHGDGTNQVTQQVGDDVQSNGTDGFAAGNVFPLAGQGMADVFGNAVSALSSDSADGTSAVQSTNGGDSTTAGDGGTISGNILGGELQPFGRGFGNGVGVFGAPVAEGTDSSQLTNGGAHTTTPGDFGSGMVGDLPAVVSPNLFGNGIGVLGANVVSAGMDNIQTTNSTAEPSAYQYPFSLLANVHSFRVPILSTVLSTGTANGTSNNAGEQIDPLDLTPDALPGPSEMPSLPSTQAAPMKSAATSPVQLPQASTLANTVEGALGGLSNPVNVQPNLPQAGS